MDLEFRSNSSCVILSLMGLDEQPIKKLVQRHKRVLSDEYHQRVASTASLVRRSSFKRYSFGMSKNRESREASVEICQNKRCKTSTEEEMSDVLSAERNALGGKCFVDELVSETYSSHDATKHYFAFVNSSEHSTSFTGRYSFKGSLGNSYMGGKDGNYIAYLLKNHNGCRPYSRFSSASSVIYRRRDSEKQNEALHQRSFIVSNALRHGEVDGSVSQKSNQEGGPLKHDNKVELFSQKSPEKISSMLDRNRSPLSDHAIEQEKSLKLSADSFYTDGSRFEMDSFKSFPDNYLHSPDSVLESFDDEKPPKLSEHGTHLHSLGFTLSTAWSGETRTTASADEDRKDHSEAGCREQDRSKPTAISGNREFNYLIDILTAAGFCRKNLASSLDKWRSVESPLSPFIFKTVEKIYADDKSWETSERLLLFDRINSRLEGILHPSMLVSSRHISARISDRFLQLSEDVLWSSLVKEARELKGETIEDLLESDLGSLDVGEFIESIVTEIEQVVINELAAELVE